MSLRALVLYPLCFLSSGCIQELHDFGRGLYQRYGRDELSVREEAARVGDEMVASLNAKPAKHSPAIEKFFGFRDELSCQENLDKIERVCKAQFDSRPSALGHPTKEKPGEIPITRPDLSRYENCLLAGNRVAEEAGYCIHLEPSPTEADPNDPEES